MINEPNSIIDIIDGIEYPRTEYISCPLCHKSHKPKRISVTFGMTAMVAECSYCHIAYQSPRPSLEASHAYMNWRWQSNDKYVHNTENQIKRAKKQLSLVNKKFNKPGKLLDFGAGSGAFVRVAREAGWAAHGVEQSPAARERAQKNHNVELYENVPDETYDVIAMWDVIEHLRNPQQTLEQLRLHLNDDGYLFIETGNIENWQKLLFDDKWGLYLFDHHFYFSPASLEELVRRAGFSEFGLLKANRKHPTLNPIKLLINPFHALRAWSAWIKSKKMWPDHGNINIMVTYSRK